MPPSLPPILKVLNPFFPVFEPGLGVWRCILAQKWFKIPNSGPEYVHNWGAFLRKINTYLTDPLDPPGASTPILRVLNPFFTAVETGMDMCMGISPKKLENYPSAVPPTPDLKVNGLFFLWGPKMVQEALTSTRCSSARFGDQRVM